MSDKTAVIGTFCFIGCLLHSAWTETKLNHRHTEERWHVTRRCRGKEATGQTGRAKVRGRSRGGAPRVSSSAVSFFFSEPSEPPSVPGLGEARPGDKLPWQHVTAICCWSMDTHKLARLRMTWDGTVWSAPKLSWPYLCRIESGAEGKEHVAALSVLALRASLPSLFWLDNVFICRGLTHKRAKRRYSRNLAKTF